MSCQLRAKDTSRKGRVTHGANGDTVSGESGQHQGYIGAWHEGHDHTPDTIFDMGNRECGKSWDACLQPLGEERLAVLGVTFLERIAKLGGEQHDLGIVRNDRVDAGLEVEALLFKKGVADIEEDRGRRGHANGK